MGSPGFLDYGHSRKPLCPSKFGLSVDFIWIYPMKRVALGSSDEKGATSLIVDGPVMDLALSMGDYGRYRPSVGRMLYDCRNRKCYKQHDKYYGLLGILEYTNFPVTYDITMEDLGSSWNMHTTMGT